MEKFNLENYETVKSRKAKFYSKYPDGRIIVRPIELNDKGAIFECKIYKNVDEQIKDLPIATGFAQEFKGQGGFANKFSWCENCEESAIGRALDNAGFSNGKCSREEMVKVQQHEETEVKIKQVESLKPQVKQEQVKPQVKQVPVKPQVKNENADANNAINKDIINRVNKLTNNRKDEDELEYIKSEILGIKNGTEILHKTYDEKRNMLLALDNYERNRPRKYEAEELPF